MRETDIKTNRLWKKLWTENRPLPQRSLSLCQNNFCYKVQQGVERALFSWKDLWEACIHSCKRITYWAKFASVQISKSFFLYSQIHPSLHTLIASQQNLHVFTFSFSFSTCQRLQSHNDHFTAHSNSNTKRSPPTVSSLTGWTLCNYLKYLNGVESCKSVHYGSISEDCKY